MTCATSPQADDDLDTLLMRTQAPITARPPWWSAWARAYAYTPWMVSVADCSAVAPLGVRRQRAQSEIRVLGGDQADQARLPAIDGRSARALAEQLSTQLNSLDHPWHLRLEHLPTGDPVAQRLSEQLIGSDLREVPALASPYVRLWPGCSVNDFLGKVARKTQRRTERGFTHAGGVVWHTQDPFRIVQLAPQLARIRRARDHGCNRVSDLDSSAGYDFWIAVLAEHARHGELEVAVAEVDSQVVAYDIVLLDGQIERLWDGRVAPEAEGLSVGRLLQDVALARAIDRGATELDLMRGVTPAKLRLATDIRRCTVLEAWSSAHRRRLTQASRRAMAQARQVRDGNDHLDRLWRGAKQRALNHPQVGPGEHRAPASGR